MAAFRSHLEYICGFSNIRALNRLDLVTFSEASFRRAQRAPLEERVSNFFTDLIECFPDIFEVSDLARYHQVGPKNRIRKDIRCSILVRWPDTTNRHRGRKRRRRCPIHPTTCVESYHISSCRALCRRWVPLQERSQGGVVGRWSVKMEVNTRSAP